MFDDDVDKPSFDLDLDLKSLQIVMKTSHSLSCDPNIDNDTFDQLDQYVQLYHSRSKIRFDPHLSNFKSISTFLLERERRWAKPLITIYIVFVYSPNKVVFCLKHN